MNKPKFRVWDKDSKKVYEVEIIDFKKDVIKLVDYGWTFLNDIILMQYTGLKDKNGVEIFEGDVVEGFYGRTYVKGLIELIDGSYCLQEAGADYAVCLFEVVDRKNLGSIHENPELLNEVE